MPRKTPVCIRQKDRHASELEAGVIEYLDEAVFTPLVHAAQPDPMPEDRNEHLSDLAVVAAALERGEIHYEEGYFRGRFHARLSLALRNLGAQPFGSMGFYMSEESMSPSLRVYLSKARAKARQKHEAVLGVIAAILSVLPQTKTGLDLASIGLAITTELDVQWFKALGRIPERSLPIGFYDDFAGLTQAKVLGLTQAQVEMLRERVEESALQGQTVYHLEDVIRTAFQQTKVRAHFLSEHQTALLVSKYRKVRADQYGVEEYLWETSGDERVRAGHSLLRGRQFRWDDPPITDLATGAHNHPGEDYNCRCVAVLLIPSAETVGVDSVAQDASEDSQDDH